MAELAEFKVQKLAELGKLGQLRMYFLYSIAYTIGFLLMIPAFLLNRQKYASGFRQRLGNYPEFKHDEGRVIWLHCVSVGETNAARPLVDKLREGLPDHRLIISTTTKTGQDLAYKIFHDKAEAVVYFPFDWKFTVQRAIDNFKPALVLLMETEIWPRFIHEAKLSGAKIAIVNGRLSENSFRRYSKVRPFISRVLSDIDLALMQGEQDAKRLGSLGMPGERIQVSGNLKFDHSIEANETELTNAIRARFGIDGKRPLIVAASTHNPEERWIFDAFASIASDRPKSRARLIIAPRHPERFDEVAQLIDTFRYSDECKWHDYSFVRRSHSPSDTDKTADVILLDSVGELRSIYSLAEIVFVGGSLIPHGGQNVLEPAAAGRPIVTGPFTHNFAAIVNEFLANRALIQLPEAPQDFQVPERLYEAFTQLLENENERTELGSNAAAVMTANRGATSKTVDYLTTFFSGRTEN